MNRVLFWSELTGASVYIVHVTQGKAVAAIAAAKARGVAARAETCPHYLMFDQEDFDEIGPLAKCAPPLRSRATVEELWSKVLAGDVDVIASDHSPCLLQEKTAGESNIWLAWGGISGLQSSLSVMLTEGVSNRGLSMPDIVRMMSGNPARIFGLYPRKGSLTPGADADLTLVDADEEFILRDEDLFYKNKHSVYVGRRFRGRVKRTIVRGRTVFADGRVVAPAGYGELLTPRARE